VEAALKMPAPFIDKKEQELLQEHLKKSTPQSKHQNASDGGQMVIID